MSHLSWLQGGPYARFQRRISKVAQEEETPYGHVRSYGRRRENPLQGGMSPRRVRFRFRAKTGLAIEMVNEHLMDGVGQAEFKHRQREYERQHQPTANSKSDHAAATQQRPRSPQLPLAPINSRPHTVSSRKPSRLRNSDSGLDCAPVEPGLARGSLSSVKANRAQTQHGSRPPHIESQNELRRPHSPTQNIASAIMTRNMFVLEHASREASYQQEVERAEKEGSAIPSRTHRNRYDLLLDDPCGTHDVEKLLELCHMGEVDRICQFAQRVEEARVRRFHDSQLKLPPHRRKSLPPSSPGILNEVCSTGYPPLCIAAARNDYNAIPLLIAAGCFCDIRDNNGFGPLHWAAARGFCRCVRALLEAGASSKLLDRAIRPFHRMMAGISPIDVAKRFNQTAALELMMEFRRQTHDQIVKGRFVPEHPSSLLTTVSSKFVDEENGGDGSNWRPVIELGRGFEFPISEHFDPSDGLDAERRALSRAGRLAPLRKSQEPDPPNVVQVEKQSPKPQNTAVGIPEVPRVEGESELQHIRRVVAEAERRAAEARRLTLAAQQEVETLTNPETKEHSRSNLAPEGAKPQEKQARRLGNARQSPTNVFSSSATESRSQTHHMPHQDRELRKEQIKAMDNLRGLKAFRTAVQVAVSRWKNSAAKRKLRDKLKHQATKRAQAWEKEEEQKKRDIELRKQWTQAKQRAAAKKQQQLLFAQNRMVRIAGDALLLPDFEVPVRRRLHTKSAKQQQRRRKAGGAILKVWSKGHTKDGGNAVPDSDIEVAEQYVSPLQLCLEEIDEKFGEEAAIASEKVLMKRREEKLLAQWREDEIFVCATIIQNLYRQRAARRRLRFQRAVVSALRAKEQAEKEAAAQARIEEAKKAAAIRAEIESLRELEYFLQKSVVSVRQLEAKLRTTEKANLGSFDAQKYWDDADIDLREWALSVGLGPTVAAKMVARTDGAHPLAAFLYAKTAVDFHHDLGISLEDAEVLWVARQERVKSRVLAGLHQRLAVERKALEKRRDETEKARQHFFEGKRARQRAALAKSCRQFEEREGNARVVALRAATDSARSAMDSLVEEDESWNAPQHGRATHGASPVTQTLFWSQMADKYQVRDRFEYSDA